MFVDASAIVAILTREAGADELVNALDGARSPITSPTAVFEATLGVCRKRHASVAEAQQDVLEFLGTAGVQTVSITGKEAEAALDTFSRYGKGRGHPARLNLGDCFAYAVARTYRASLLFKGEDFDKTDIRSAREGRAPPRPARGQRTLDPITQVNVNRRRVRLSQLPVIASRHFAAWRSRATRQVFAVRLLDCFGQLASQ